MKKTAVLLFIVVPALAQQKFDFKSLDRLGANAKESTNVTLEGPMLKLASGFLGNDKDAASLKSVIANLNGIYVRSFDFDAPGKYNAADLDSLRAWLDSQHWSKIIDVKESGETSQIYLSAAPDNSTGGLVIITAEPKEVTVVYVDGRLSMDDLGKLSGQMGIPDITFMNDGKPKPAPKSGKKEE